VQQEEEDRAANNRGTGVNETVQHQRLSLSLSPSLSLSLFLFPSRRKRPLYYFPDTSKVVELASWVGVFAHVSKCCVSREGIAR
jgi:hypothetical protein